MTVITVLGAGAMGSALCTPVADAGWEVRLWGTWLDDHLLDAVERGEPHPRTKEPLAQGVHLYRSDQLEEALAGANVVVMSVASVGVPKVTELALAGIAKADALWMTSKGFCEAPDGTVEQLPVAIRRIAQENGYNELPPIVAIAGPVKANECAGRKPTATIFGCLDGAVSKKYAQAAATSNYAIEHTDDEVGVEICAPMKNVYAIALGIADGLEEATGVPHHNLKAATFTQAVKEMSLLGQSQGAKPQTAFGLPGVGDLEVTGLSGRNKVYGVRLGRGENPAQALAEMDRLEQTVEGVPAAGLAIKFVHQHAADIADELPLLNAVVKILNEETTEPVKDVVAQAVLPRA
ncbi:glycerol-3-phosphate dehydrogenase [Gleimia hominis]|uniref:Glycerol-3-phosphate dehydrogenase n=1 Tax=Gleimia hominis TaxID=595468 RepID=A0ABU3I8Y2_9ACTO|nr:glycerol-3-phosphate dehydrogenase [Gleimia hominis]MDT3766823.1 glycerol-3-phosphate dehydrogenase [Gleimia hominis]